MALTLVAPPTMLAVLLLGKNGSWATDCVSDPGCFTVLNHRGQNDSTSCAHLDLLCPRSVLIPNPSLTSESSWVGVGG